MSENGQRPRCAGATQSGQRCRLPAQTEGGFCHIHARTPALAAPAPAPAVPAPAPAAPAPDPAQTLRQEVRHTLRHLAARIEAGETGRQGLRALTPAEVTALLQDQTQPLPSTLRAGLLALIEEASAQETLDAEAWRGAGYILQITLHTPAHFLPHFLRQRLRGEYEVDAWGYDPEIADLLALIAGVFFHTYWRIELTGVEHLPQQGRALLAANQSSILPLEGAMVAYGVRAYHPARRLLRVLAPTWLPDLPFWTMLLQKAGHAPAHAANARRLLAEESLVLAFPEGYRGVERAAHPYRLRPFQSSDLLAAALEMAAPILPVSVVGAAEAYPLLANARPIARLLGLPAFPITTTWPWLGPLGALPLPSKWWIDIGPPLPGAGTIPERAADPRFLAEMAALLRERIQAQIDQRLQSRGSRFRG